MELEGIMPDRERQILPGIMESYVKKKKKYLLIETESRKIDQWLPET